MTTATQPFTGSFTADPDHSSFQAQLRHMGVGSFRTSFEGVDARLDAGPDGPQLTGTARVDSISIKHPAELRSHIVDGDDFFDAQNHPEIKFESRRLDFADDGTVALDGVLSMRGTEQPITATGIFRAPVEDLYGADRASLELDAEIDRRDWGMSYQAKLPGGGEALSWTIQLSAHLELIADAN